MVFKKGNIPPKKKKLIEAEAAARSAEGNPPTGPMLPTGPVAPAKITALTPVPTWNPEWVGKTKPEPKLIVKDAPEIKPVVEENFPVVKETEEPAEAPKTTPIPPLEKLEVKPIPAKESLPRAPPPQEQVKHLAADVPAVRWTSERLRSFIKR